MSKCEKCGAPAEAAETYEFAGESLCEDCYLEERVKPIRCDPWWYLEERVKPIRCDPWTVYSARSTKGKAPQLTEIQRRILSLIKNEGPLEAPEICGQLGISEAQFQDNFATLRHMELARGFKDGDKVRYTLFSRSSTRDQSEM